MKPIETITDTVAVLHARRHRHRPDHPQAVPQAGRADRLRRVPLLRLGQGARLGPARRPRSSSPATTSAAARAASTRRGRWRTTASGRSSPRASPTSSSPTAPRSACCRSSWPRPTSGAIAEAGEAQVDLAAQEVRWAGGTARFEIDPDIKHRLLNGLDDIGLTLAAGRGDRRLRGRPRALGPVTTAL